jgi:APA family basic amino acid/polyamine antiporter
MHPDGLLNIGTLLAFLIVCAAVRIIRKSAPELHHPLSLSHGPVGHRILLALDAFFAPGKLVPFDPLAAGGFAVYFSYGRYHSALGRIQDAHP